VSANSFLLNWICIDNGKKIEKAVT